MRKRFRATAYFLLWICLFNIVLGTRIMPVNATLHTGDIEVSGEDVFVIEGSFQQNGSIIVREKGKLILDNAALEITQQEGLLHKVSVRDNGTLETYNSYVSSTLHTPLALFDNAVAKIQKSTFDGNVPIEPMNQSLVNVTDSELSAIYSFGSSNVAVFNSSVYDFSSSDSSTLRLYGSSSNSIFSKNEAVVKTQNSSVSAVWTTDLVNAYVFNSSISSLSSSGDSKVYLNRSSVNSISVNKAPNVLLSNLSKVEFCDLTIDNSMLYLAGLKEGYIAHASIGPESYGWNVTVDDSIIKKISLKMTGMSSLIIGNSTLDQISLFSSSTATIIDSQIDWLDSNDKSVAVLFNSQVNYTNSQKDARILELSSYAGQYVFYETLGLAIAAIIILISFFFLLRRKKTPEAATLR